MFVFMYQRLTFIVYNLYLTIITPPQTKHLSWKKTGKVLHIQEVPLIRGCFPDWFLFTTITTATTTTLRC